MQQASLYTWKLLNTFFVFAIPKSKLRVSKNIRESWDVKNIVKNFKIRSFHLTVPGEKVFVLVETSIHTILSVLKLVTCACFSWRSLPVKEEFFLPTVTMISDWEPQLETCRIDLWDVLILSAKLLWQLFLFFRNKLPWMVIKTETQTTDKYVFNNEYDQI